MHSLVTAAGPEGETQIKTFLREIRLRELNSAHESTGQREKDNFWSKVFSQKTLTRESSVTKLVKIKLDVGGWINLPPGVQNVLSLLVIFEDRMGEHSLVLDQMNARGATQILLSGSAEIETCGKIRTMSVYCGGIDDKTVWIDSMHVHTEEIETNYVSLSA